MSVPTLKLPTLQVGPNPISLCKKGNFDNAFQILDTRKKPCKLRKRCLLYAAAQGNLEAVIKLVDKYQVNPKFINEEGISPLQCAVFYGHLNVVKFLLNKDCGPKGDPNTLLLCACNSLSDRTVKRALSKFSVQKDDFDVLHHRVEILKILFDHGWKLKESDYTYTYYHNGTLLPILKLIMSSGGVHDLIYFLDHYLSKSKLKVFISKSSEKIIKICSFEMIKYLSESDLLEIEVTTIKNVAEGITDDVCKYLVENCSDDLFSTTIYYSGDVLLDYACEHKLFTLCTIILSKHSLNSRDSRGRTPLHIACKHNYLELVSFLVSKQCDQSVVDNNGCLALHIACMHSKIDIVRLLKIIDIKDKSANTPLHLACKANDIDIIEYLVNENKCILNGVNTDNELPLHIAISRGANTSLEIIKIVSKSVDVNLLDKNGSAPVHIACRYGNLSILKFLACERKCNLGLLSKDAGSLPLNTILRRNSDPEVIDAIIKILGCSQYDVNEQDGQKNTLLHITCLIENIELARYLVVDRKCDVNIINGDGNLPLHIACRSLSIDMVKLVSKSMEASNLLLKNCDNKTVFHVVCNSHYFYSHYYTREEESDITRRSIVRYLVKSGYNSMHLHPEAFSDLNVKLFCTNENDFDILSKLATKDNVNECASLFDACTCNNIKAVRLFTQVLKCNLSITQYRNLPLHIACTHSAEMVELVIQGIDVNSTDSNGNTPLHIACEHGKVGIIELLINKYKCNPLVLNENMEYPLHLACAHSLDAIKMLPIGPDEIKSVSVTGLTPLHVACKSNNLEIVQHLVSELCHDISDVIERGTIHLLQLACETGNPLLVKYLIENGANTFERFTDGNAVLHLACKTGSFEIVKFLVDNGHSTSITNARNELPVHIACTKALDLVEITSYKCTAEELESKTIDNLTPLHIAASYGLLNVVKFLIERRNCSPFILDFYGNNSLAYACGLTASLQFYHYKSFPAIAKYLVENGCNPQEDPASSSMSSPLQFAITQKDFELLRALVENELHINCPDKDGNTPLLLLCKQLGKYANNEKTEFVIKAVKFLVKDRICDQFIHNCEKEFALHVACESKSIDLVKILDCSHCGTTQDGNGDTPLHIVCQENLMDIFKHFLEHVECSGDILNKKKQTILHLAVINNNVEMVKLILTKFHDYSSTCKDSKGLAPIHYASSTSVLKLLVLHDSSNKDLIDSCGNSPLHSYIMKLLVLHDGSNKDLIDSCGMELLVFRDGSNIDSCDNLPLRSSRESDLISMIKYLLSVGASVSIKNDEGNTALHLACMVEPLKKGKQFSCFFIVPVIQQLLLHGASVFIQNSNGNTPLHLACNAQPQSIRIKGKKGKKIRKISSRHTVKENQQKVIKSNAYIRPVIQQLLSEHTVIDDDDDDDDDDRGNVVLHEEISREDRSLCIFVQNSSGDTPLHIACSNASFPVVDELLKNCNSYADLFAIKNSHGDIPFHVALELFQESQLGKVKKSRGSLEYFACYCKDINVQNADKETLLHLACKVINQYSVQLVKFFVDSQANLESVDIHNQLPLHIAASRSLAIVKLCCKQSIVNEQDKDGNTPLHIACYSSKMDIVTYLLEDMKCIPILRNSKGQTPLHCACISGNNGIILLLATHTLKSEKDLSLQDKDGVTPLHLLCKATNLLSINRLKGHSSNISLQNDCGETPLHVVCNNSKSGMKLVKCVVECDPTCKLKDEPCDTALHLACRYHSHEVIECLINNGHRTAVAIKNAHGELPLHILCKRNDMDFILTFKLMSKYLQMFDQKTSEGDTPLHIALKNKVNKESIFYLIREAKCSIDIANNEGDLPHHIACRNNNMIGLELLQLLTNKEIIDKQNLKGNTVLHECCFNTLHYMDKILAYILDDCGAKKDLANNDGEFPMHIACRILSLKIVKLFEPHGLAVKTKNGNTVLHEACLNTTRSACEIVLYLLNNGQLDYTAVNSNADLAAHIACRNPVLKIELNQIIALLEPDVNCINKNGNTLLHELLINEQSQDLILNLLEKPSNGIKIVNSHSDSVLHLACQSNLRDVVKFLLNERLPEVQWFLAHENDRGQTPVVLTTDKAILQLLLDYGASAQPLYQMHDNYFREYGIHSPPETPVSFLIVGDPHAGKTTLVSSLKKERDNMKTETFHRTAGIVPNDFKSEKYGQVTMYDFAGQPEYYASHDAIIHSTIKKSPPIVLLVVDLTFDIDRAREIISYWSTFIKNRLISLSDRAHLYIVCSHADIVEEESGKNPEVKAKALLSTVDEKLKEVDIFSFKDLLTMDCTKSQSKEINELRKLLAESTKQLRKKAVINFESHCLSTFIAQTFKGEIVIPVEKLIFKATQATKTKAVGHKLVPQDPEMLKKICRDLNDNGIIIFLENRKMFHRSWLVLDKDALLANVSGILFAPSSFPKYVGVYGSNTGVVTFSKLRDIFPQYDPNMLFGFLCQMEYCHEITDNDVKQLLKMKESSSHEKYYFFPNVVKVERPPEGWPCENGYQFGWMMECDNDHFSPYFIQILLLRLMFGETKIISLQQAPLDIHSISTVWKSGIAWTNPNGIRTIVDVVAASKVLVLLHCKGTMRDKVDLLKYRSSLLKVIRCVKFHICPAIKVREFIIDPESICFPLQSSYSECLVSMDDITAAIHEGNRYVFTKSGKYIELNSLLLFDPYSHLCDILLGTIQNLEYSDKRPNDGIFEALSDHLCAYLEIFSEIIHPSVAHQNEIDAMKSSAAKFLKLLKIWLQRKKNTLQTLRNEFDTITIFDKSNLPGKHYVQCVCVCVCVCLKSMCETINYWSSWEDPIWSGTNHGFWSH